jgi:uncharacterized membrane protein YfcA
MHTDRVRSLLVGLVLVTAAGPVSGQRLATAYPRWEPKLESRTPAPAARLFPPAPDHRWEGLVVGGAFVGLLGASLGHGFCGYDDSGPRSNCLWPTLEGFLIGATVGGVTGGLLGTLIPKPPPEPSP